MVMALTRDDVSMVLESTAITFLLTDILIPCRNGNPHPPVVAGEAGDHYCRDDT